MERAAEREKELFTFEWHYAIRLEHCLLYLKPDDLPIRRVWNKKYPMKLCLPTAESGRVEVRKRRINSTLEDLTIEMNSVLSHSSADDSSGELFFDFDSDGSSGSEEESTKSNSKNIAGEHPTEEGEQKIYGEDFFLFSNTGREKEDLFYRIQLCIKPLKHQVSDFLKNSYNYKDKTKKFHFFIFVKIYI